MTDNELLAALRRLKVETGSLACLGCGHEHSCGIHGCAILRDAERVVLFYAEEAHEGRKESSAPTERMKKALPRKGQGSGTYSWLWSWWISIHKRTTAIMV